MFQDHVEHHENHTQSPQGATCAQPKRSHKLGDLDTFPTS